MAKTAKKIDATKIATRAQAMRACKAIGFVDSPFIMTRGTKMLTGFDLSITLAPENFIITDRQHTLTFIPSCLNIGNTAAGAREKLQTIYDACFAHGILTEGDGQEIHVLGLAVAIAQLAHTTRATQA